MLECNTGKILIGVELTLQLDILLSYFYSDYIKIDFTEAHKRIKFIETECKHSEAPFAGKPFLLMLFQKAFIEAIYIFYVYDQEIYDRFTDEERIKSTRELTCANGWVKKHKEIIFLVSRKNGKTPLISAICLAEFFCGEKGTKILCSSNDYSQADLAFQAINAMREESKTLEKVTRKNIKGIFFGNPKNKKTKGKFSYSNKGNILKISARTGAKEGKNIRVGMADEIHEMKDNSLTMPIRQALSTQNNPIYFELTTEGFINDGYLDERLKEARLFLDGELERPDLLAWLYTQDSEAEVWQNEESWIKSNPGLGKIKKKSFLTQKIEEAKTSKSTRVYVLAKDFNIKQNNASAWLMTEEINNTETFNIEEFKGCFAIGGVDLSKSGDLSSARLILMRKGDKKKYTIQKYFIPESKINELSKEEQKIYLEWIRQGLITISPGNENDFSLITKWFIELYKKYQIRFYKIGYDKWSAIYWVKEMEENLNIDCKRVDQNFGTMSEPMKLLEADLKSKLINYNDNPMDKYCLENTALNMDSKGNIMPTKIQGKENKKIDGAVTMMISYRIYIDNRAEFLRLVEGR
jgi:phage terminase large subunit-like protein